MPQQFGGLELLGKHIGMFTGRPSAEQRRSDEDPLEYLRELENRMRLSRDPVGDDDDGSCRSFIEVIARGVAKAEGHCALHTSPGRRQYFSGIHR